MFRLASSRTKSRVSDSLARYARRRARPIGRSLKEGGEVVAGADFLFPVAPLSSFDDLGGSKRPAFSYVHKLANPLARRQTLVGPPVYPASSIHLAKVNVSFRIRRDAVNV